jgi:septal ring factor EnvC (AmiA/AmiB activator)
MKYIVSFILILVPIFLVAKEQLIQGSNKTEVVNVQEHKTTINQQNKTTDEEILKKIQDLRNGYSEKVKSELTAYAAKKKELETQIRALTQSLSQEARESIREESQLRRQLSWQGKKAFYGKKNNHAKSSITSQNKESSTES